MSRVVGRKRFYEPARLPSSSELLLTAVPFELGQLLHEDVETPALNVVVVCVPQRLSDGGTLGFSLSCNTSTGWGLKVRSRKSPHKCCKVQLCSLKTIIPDRPSRSPMRIPLPATFAYDGKA